MTDHSGEDVSSTAEGRGRFWPGAAGIALLGLLVCGMAITTRSYWLDEAYIYKATMPTLATWWTSMRDPGSCEVQQPFYHLFAWGWEKLAGSKEWALRAANVPWFVLGLVVMWRALATAPLLRRSMLLVLLCSPFAWYYLNETRPYAMHMGAGLVVLAALYRLGLSSITAAEERRWLLALCLGSLLLAASGMLAMLWLGAYLGAAAMATPWDRWRRLFKPYPWMWGVTLTLLLAEGLYYLWTLSIGARATAVGGTDIRNPFFILFELLGFSGLGPGRLAIRSGGIGEFRRWLPWLVIYGALLAVVLVAGLRQLRTSTSLRARLSWGVAFGLVAAFILGVGVAVRFRVLGRHFAAVLPLVSFILANGVAALLQPRRWSGRLAVMAFVGLNLISCGMLRFSERHFKDDYRSAAALGLEALARGETVWWNAAKEGALIYHLSVADWPGATNTALHLMNPTDGFERNLAQPTLVLTSKPDVYDANGVVQAYLARAGFQPTATFIAFTAWRAPGK